MRLKKLADLFYFSMRLKIFRFLLFLILLVATIFLIQLKSMNTNLGTNKISYPYNDRSVPTRINITSIEFLRRSSICLYKKPKIIILVTSHIFNVENRNIIRRSYPKDLFNKFNAHIIFLLAVAPKFNETFIRINAKEFQQHDDIIQGVFTESYHNLTYKHLMGFKWVYEFCRSAEYIVKMDDDIVLNYYKLFQILRKYKSNFELMGHVIDHMKPIRDKQNKWYVSKEEYKDSQYPDFLSGWVYAATTDSVRLLLKHAHLAQFLWIDDLFVTGILRKKANIKLTDIRQYFRYEPKNLECCISNKYSCDFLAAPNGKDFNITMKFFEHLWECRYKKVCLLKSSEGASCLWSETLATRKFDRFNEIRFQLPM